MNSQSKDGHRLFFCYYCLKHFTTEEILKNHAGDALKLMEPKK